MVFSLELKHRHVVNNCVLTAGHISTGHKIMFGSQLTWTRDLSDNGAIASRPVCLRPYGLGHQAFRLKSKAERLSLWSGDDLGACDLREGRGVHLALASISLIVSSLQLKHGFALNNCALAAIHISIGREIVFRSQLTWTRDLSQNDNNHIVPNSPTTVPVRQSSL